MSKNNQLPVALQLVNYMKKKYPLCFDKVDNIRAGKDWNKKIYIPISVTLSILIGSNEISPELFLQVRDDAVLLAAVAGWRRYKEIFLFDEDLQKELLDSEKDFLIPVEVLKNVPYDNFYVQLGNDNSSNGFFVFFDEDVNTNRLELRISYIAESEISHHYFILPKENKTIGEILTEMYQSEIREYELGISNKKYVDEQMSFWIKILQLILYLCADNADIKENEIQKSITRQPTSSENIKDKFREIRKWDVGFRVGNQLREYSKAHEVSVISTKKTASKRSHTKMYVLNMVLHTKIIF